MMIRRKNQSNSEEILFVLSIKLVQYIPLKEYQDFNLEVAQEFMKSLEKTSKKPRSLRTKLYVYDNGLQLEQGNWNWNYNYNDSDASDSSNNFVGYDQIKKYITFRSRMQILLLGIAKNVIENRRKERGFMFIFTKCSDDTKRLCDAIENGENFDLRTISTTSSIKKLDDSSPIVSMSNSKNRSNVERINNLSDGFEFISENQECPWEVDIKYITYDPINGNKLDDNGPIYMYTAHQVVPRQNQKASSLLGSTTALVSSKGGLDLEGKSIFSRASRMPIISKQNKQLRSSSQNSDQQKLRKSKVDSSAQDHRKNLIRYLSKSDFRRDLSPLSSIEQNLI